MNLTFQGYLALYTYILIGGIWTIFVLTVLVLAGFYCAKWVQVGMKLIGRYFDRRMRSGQITRTIKKAKAAIKAHFAFEKNRKPALIRGGKKVEEGGK